MFLGRHLLLLSRKLLKGPDDAEAGVARLDDIIDVAFLRRLVRVVEKFFVLLFLGGPDLLLLGWILYSLDVLA